MYLESLYYAATPYNIITAISIALSNNDTKKSDLYINPQFEGAKDYATRIKELNLFNQVFLIDEYIYLKHWNSSISFFAKFEIVLSYLFPKKVARDIIPNNRIYKKIYSPNKDLICRILHFYHKKNRVENELILYEEGDATYVNDSEIIVNGFDKIIRRLLYRNENTNKLLVYSPELFRRMWGGYQYYELIGLPSIKNVTMILNKVTGYTEEYALSEKVVIIDSLKSFMFDDENIKKIENIYVMINSVFGSNNVIVKRHPKELVPNNPQLRYFDYSNFPFEILFANKEKSFLIVSYLSTAVITPKIIFNEEPYIVLLYKLVDSDYYLPKSDELYGSLQSIYKNKNRIFIPNNVDELRIALETISSEFID